MTNRVRIPVMPEEWRPIPSIPGYEASSWGRVRKAPRRSLRNNRVYGGTAYLGAINVHGYRTFYTSEGSGSKRKMIRVSRAVCEAFHGPAPADRPLCLHEDENSLNNAPSNLRWGTNTENLNYPGARQKFRDHARGRARKYNRLGGTSFA